MKYLLVIALTVLVSLGCVYGFSCISCESCGEGTESAETLSVTVLSDEREETEEDETAEVKQWVKVTFDIVVIALTLGVIVLVWWAVKRVMKRHGGHGRRFG